MGNEMKTVEAPTGSSTNPVHEPELLERDERWQKIGRHADQVVFISP